MRRRSLALVAAVALLGGAAQVDAHGGGFVGGPFHGGAPRGMAPPITTPPPASIAPIPPHGDPLYMAPPPERQGDDQVQHDFRRDGDVPQDVRRGRERFGAPIGFSGGDTGFIARPTSRAIPVLYNYYYGASGSYYSNVVSDYGAPETACPDGRQDNCQN
jgi:hypothetical protein